MLHNPNGPARAGYEHVVQFYVHDDELVSGVGSFLAAGLHANEGVVVVATEDHRLAIERSLAARGIDLEAVRARGLYVSSDAGSTLDSIMTGDEVEPDRFEEVVAGLICRVTADVLPIRIFGEMVNLLWEAGNLAGALNLEAMWNDLSTRYRFSLYCAYASALDDEQDLVSMKGVCDSHTEVLTPHGYQTRPKSTVSDPIARRVDASARSELFVPVPLAARAVRQFVADALTTWGCADLVDQCELIVSELASNALLHAESPFRVTVSLHDDRIRLTVEDASCLAPIHRPATLDASGGRGVGIVAALSRDWGTETSSGGKLVWVDVDMPSR